MTGRLRSRLDDLRQRVVHRWRDVAGTMTHDIVRLVSLLVIFPLNTRGLGTELYGKYTVLYLIFGLTGLWVYAGPAAATVQLVLQMQYDRDEVLRLARRQIYSIGLLGGAVGTLITVLMFGSSLLVPALIALFADFLVTSIANVNLATVLAIEGVVTSARLRMYVPIARVIGVVGLALIDGITVLSLVCVNLGASLILLARTEYVVRRRASAEPGAHPTAMTLLRYSGYYSTTMSTNSVQDEGEKFVLASARSEAEVGQYAAAYRIVSTSLMPIGAIVSAANRWFLVPDESPRVHQLRAIRLAVPIMVYGMIAGVGIVLGRGVIAAFAGSEFDEVETIAVWLCALPVLHGLAELAPMGLIALGRNRERMMMGFAGSAIALVAYIVLVPWFGWRGAVAGTYISETAGIAIGWALLARYQRLADLAGGHSSDAASTTSAKNSR